MKDKFNLHELKKEWEDGFYESAWNADTLSMTEVEANIHEQLRFFLPGHMPVYDWNRPYADEIILIIRREIAKVADEGSDKDEN